MQHGLADYTIAVSMLRSIAGRNVVPLVRVPWNDPADIMRLLDAGASGVICPMINSRAECEKFVGACRYPPLGYRSYGPIRANLIGGQDYYTTANENVLTLAMIETVQALENLDEIVTTPGLSGIYVGTIDLSISMGLSELGNHSHPELKKALDRILEATKSHNLVIGIHAYTTELVTTFSRQGFSILTIANDTELLKQGARERCDQTGCSLGQS